MKITEPDWVHQRLSPNDSAALAEANAFVCAQRGHYRQRPLPLELEPAHTLWVTRKNGEIKACALLEVRITKIPGLHEWVIRRGPVYSCEVALRAQLNALLAAGKKKAIALRINPFVEVASEPLLPDYWQQSEISADYADTLVCKVENDAETQWRTLRRSTRTAINRARKATLNVRTLTAEDDFRRFESAFHSFANERGIAGVTRRELDLAHVFAIQAPADAYLLSAELDDEVLGQMLFMRCGNGLVYEHGWMADSARDQKIPVMHLLLWEAINVARQLRLPELDLGGFWVERGNEDPINHFKLGFSKTVRHYMPAYQRILAPVRYALLQYIRRMRS